MLYEILHHHLMFSDYRTFPQAKQSMVFGDSTNALDSSSSRAADNAVQHQQDLHSNITAVDHMSQITTAHQLPTNSTSVANNSIQESGYQD